MSRDEVQQATALLSASGREALRGRENRFGSLAKADSFLRRPKGRLLEAPEIDFCRLQTSLVSRSTVSCYQCPEERDTIEVLESTIMLELKPLKSRNEIIS